MEETLTKEYNFSDIQKKINQMWLDSGSTEARPDQRDKRYVIMMPLPNVTGALHMGHAMDNIMQDMLIRWHRMRGHNTLWMPGTDHAGIATQAVVEKRIFELEGKTRHDIGRDQLVKRIWAWKDEYQQRIIKQQQGMGCSCDWTLHRFTMDKVCTRAVREAFYRLFTDGLIYRGNRLVNWDCHLHTAVSDDEIVRKTTQGNLWHIRYPFINPKPGEPEYITVVTTRPETMLGDTAVAIHPDPEGELNRIIDNIKIKLKEAGLKERSILDAELNNLEQRKQSYLPVLLTLIEMAKDNRKICLPLMDREIPLILDEWAKPEFGSGCVKITPAHDANDYEVWQRHEAEIQIINLLNPDGTYNSHAGKYEGRDWMEVRQMVLDDLQKKNLIDKIEDHEIELALSDRSKTPIEPYLSEQWFINMGDIEENIICGKGTPKSFKTSGLAQAAIDAAKGEWKSATGKNLTFHPDSQRYASTFTNWLEEKRDWCISRQLWWGHQIPIWHGTLSREDIPKIIALEDGNDDIFSWVSSPDGSLFRPSEIEKEEPYELLVCLRSQEAEAKYRSQIEQLGLTQDPDVLDTWFSSALWPFSTLGWPDPETAEVGKDNHSLASKNSNENFLDYYYPGSCLVTGRDIITLWVARMNILGLYFLGDVPFTDCFIHANIQDGKGERMSKSKGNGIDPVDIIEEYGADAMRYVLCDMQTGTQDIKLPVQAVSPFNGELIDLATAKHGRTIFTFIDPKCGKEFDVLGTIPELPKAKITSTRFDFGRSFCTKLWNAARFALMNLDKHEYKPVKTRDLYPEDLWILSRLSDTISKVAYHLEKYNPSAALGTAREFFWSEFCDWYLELIKPRIRNHESAYVAKSVLALTMDHVLRLLHPFVPYITEALWELLSKKAPVRGLERPLRQSKLIISAHWPEPMDEWRQKSIETEFDLVKEIIRAIRDLRAQYNVPPSKEIEATLKTPETLKINLKKYAPYMKHMAKITHLTMGKDASRPALSAVAVVRNLEIYLLNVLDPEKERNKLLKQKEKTLQGLKIAEQKINNPGFVSKAPEHVVKAEQKRVEQMKNQLNLIEKSLKELI
jgi:valyl-tRNA synthetase